MRKIPQLKWSSEFANRCETLNSEKTSTREIKISAVIIIITYFLTRTQLNSSSSWGIFFKNDVFFSLICHWHCKNCVFRINLFFCAVWYLKYLVLVLQFFFNNNDHVNKLTKWSVCILITDYGFLQNTGHLHSRDQTDYMENIIAILIRSDSLLKEFYLYERNRIYFFY